MKDLDIHIKKLQEAINLLLKRHKQVQKENTQLRNLNEQLIQQLKQKEISLQEEQQKQTAKTIISLRSDNEKKSLQQKIDFYLKDIEKCLSLLNA